MPVLETRKEHKMETYTYRAVGGPCTPIPDIVVAGVSVCVLEVCGTVLAVRWHHSPVRP